MKTLYKILEKAEDKITESMAVATSKLAQRGVDFRLNNSEIEDLWHQIKDEVSDEFTPKDKKTVLTILEESPEEIKDIIEFIKSEFDEDLTNINKESVTFIPKMKTAIFTFLSRDIDYNSHNVEWKYLDRAIEILKNGHNEESLSEANYINDLIERTNQGWPLLIACDNVKDNPTIVKNAVKRTNWVKDFASLRILSMVKQSSFEEAINKDILRASLEESLINQSDTKRKANKL